MGRIAAAPQGMSTTVAPPSSVLEEKRIHGYMTSNPSWDSCHSVVWQNLKRRRTFESTFSHSKQLGPWNGLQPCHSFHLSLAWGICLVYSRDDA